MRGTRRVKKLTYLLVNIWLKNPELRFNQLIHNLQWEYAQGYGGFIELWKKDKHCFDYDVCIETYRNEKIADSYDIADENFIAFLEEKINE